jgi:hypothetical protein
LVDATSIQKWIAILEEFGQIPKDSVKADDVFTNAFNPLAALSAGNSRVP